MVSRLVKDRSFVHAAHEAARLERASSASAGPSYELRGVRRKPPEARGWAARAALRSLDRVGATHVEAIARGADLLVRATGPIGPIAIRMRSPFQAGRDVAAVCEPCFVRVDVGPRPSQPEAWALGRRFGGVVLRASSERWSGACLFPAASRSRWLPVVTPTAELGPETLLAFLEEALEPLEPEDVRAALEGEAGAGADALPRPGRWQDASRFRPPGRLRSRRGWLGAALGTLRASLAFDSLEVAHGARSPCPFSVLTGRGVERDMAVGTLSLDLRVRGRSRRVDLDAELFHLAVPDVRDGLVSAVPRTWAVVRVTTPRDEGASTARASGAERCGATLWIDGARLRAEGLDGRLGELLDRAVVAHRGPYR